MLCDITPFCILSFVISPFIIIDFNDCPVTVPFLPLTLPIKTSFLDVSPAFINSPVFMSIFVFSHISNGSSRPAISHTVINPLSPIFNVINKCPLDDSGLLIVGLMRPSFFLNSSIFFNNLLNDSTSFIFKLLLLFKFISVIMSFKQFIME